MAPPRDGNIAPPRWLLPTLPYSPPHANRRGVQLQCGNAANEVRRRSANLMTWCERCATGIHIRCANDHAIGHGGDDCIGAYRAKDIAAKSLVCLDCWTTHRPYVDESDEGEVERGDQPERHPNRLRLCWPGPLKESLHAAARRERAAHVKWPGGVAL